MSRRACRIDDNQTAIADVLRASGCSVQSLAAVGQGCPDLLVGAGGSSGFVCVMEIKDPTKPTADQAFTPMQKKWHREWLGPAYLVKTADEALAIVERLRRATKGADRSLTRKGLEAFDMDIAF